MRLALLLALMGAALTFDHAAAQTPLPGLATNGCGSGWSRYVVPDSALFGHCSFKAACDQHDLCYSRCLEGGDLHGSPACSDPLKRAERRSQCDVGLQDAIVKDNPGRGTCVLFGRLYRWAVERFAAGAFKGFAGDTAKLETMGRFVDYLVLHPGSFDPDEVQAAFDRASAAGLVIDAVEFIPGIPRLRLRGTGPEGPVMIELKGGKA